MIGREGYSSMIHRNNYGKGIPTESEANQIADNLRAAGWIVVDIHQYMLGYEIDYTVGDKHIDAGVAQRLERLAVNQRVAGSNPAPGAKNNKKRSTSGNIQRSLW